MITKNKMKDALVQIVSLIVGIAFFITGFRHFGEDVAILYEGIALALIGVSLVFSRLQDLQK